jgi:hypothetical protein
MSVLRQVLKEEVQRLKSLSKVYASDIKKLPRGSISVKSIKNGEYAYRAFRDGEKVRFEYLGKNASDEVRQLSEKIVERRKLESLKRQASKNLREAQGMLRVREY